MMCQSQVMQEGVPGRRAETADRHLDQVLPKADFAERHRRLVRVPADRVWAATMAVTPREIRLLAPFMAVRSLPRILRRREFRLWRNVQTPILKVFQDAGFVELHRDAVPVDGRAFAVYAAAGRFWSPAGNDAVRFDSPQAFVAYHEPGMAKAAFAMEVVDHGDHTEVVTETRVVGTDISARRAFRLYWLLIRGPSGLIRRSWLAAIARRAAVDGRTTT